MWSDVVVVAAPDRQLAPSIGEAVEQLLVEQLVAQRPVERFDERVLLRLARIDVVPLDPVLGRPLQDRPARKLRSVIADDPGRFAIQPHQRVEFTCDPGTRDAGVAQQAQVLPAGVNVDRQDTQPAGSTEGVGHGFEAERRRARSAQLHRPAIVRTQRDRHRRAAATCPLATAPPPHRQALFAIEQVELLVVHHVPLAFEHHADAPLAEPAALSGDLAHFLADLDVVMRTFSPDRLGVDANQPAGPAL